LSFVTAFRRPPSQDPTTAQDNPTTDGGGCVESDDGASADVEVRGDGTSGDEPVGGGRRTRMAAGAKTALAAVIVYGALVGPDDISSRAPAIFLRIPAEALVAAVVLLILPARARKVTAVAGGLFLGLLTLLKFVDIGFASAFDRPFDLVLDWILLGPAVGLLADSVGRTGAIGAVFGAVLLVAAALVLATWSVLRLTRLMVGHRSAAVRVVALLAAAWVACAAFGAQIVPGVPVASRSTAALLGDRVEQVGAGLRDKRAFAEQTAVDRFRHAPGSRLLTGLRGKDVVLTFVESYGRNAIQDPESAPRVGAVLDAGTRRLRAAGFGARSGYLESSTTGGGSWLAHATLQAGLWVTNQRRFRTLVSSDRLTLTGAFRRAGWRTVAVEPATSGAWPESEFYGFDKVYTTQNLGYRGPRLGYATMPDQYTFAAFEHSEHGLPGHPPVMAQITLVSSHSPWTPLPRFVDWDAVGDGSIFSGEAGQQGDSAGAAWTSGTSRIRAAYRQSMEYSLGTLISYVERYGDDDLVLVFLGDHQPAPIVTGPGRGRDVPVTIVARDRRVLERISGWGWTEGLKPGPRAPAWRMDAFRDRFLTAFGR
jgi:Sulfatase